MSPSCNWISMPQHGQAQPVERSSHTITALDNGNKIYLFGGEHCPRVPIGSDLYVYDATSGAWAVAPVHSGTAPSPRVAHTAAAVDGKLWIFGGRSGLEMGEGAMNDLYCYDPATAAWALVEPISGCAPPKRSYHAMVAVGPVFYIFGGCGEAGRLNDLHAFDTRTRTWTELPAPDAAAVPGRGGSCLVPSASGDCLYVLGGFCGHELGDVHTYRVAERAWCGAACASCAGGEAAAAAALPPARSVFGAAVHACGTSGCGHTGHVLAFGGEVDPSNKGHDGAGDFTASLVCFGPWPAGGWHALDAGGDAPGPRGWFASTTLPDGSMVVHGGLDRNNERLGDMFKLALGPEHGHQH